MERIIINKMSNDPDITYQTSGTIIIAKYQEYICILYYPEYSLESLKNDPWELSLSKFIGGV